MPHRHRRPSAVGLVLSACLATTVFAGCTFQARVERVVDGDTVVLEDFGTTRLIGVNAPEEGRCVGNAATRFTRRQLEDKRVEVELGKDPKDRWGRTLAYLTRGDSMHNLALVEEGYAKALTIPPNTKYAERFEAAEERAKQRDAAAEEEAKQQDEAAEERAKQQDDAPEENAGQQDEAPEEEAKQQDEGPRADCAGNRRQAAALSRARAKERAERAERAERSERAERLAERLRAERAERAERLAEQLRADKKRAKSSQRRVREDRGGAGDAVSARRRVPKTCRGFNGPIATPPGDPTNLDRDNDGKACE